MAGGAAQQHRPRTRTARASAAHHNPDKLPPIRQWPPARAAGRRFSRTARPGDARSNCGRPYNAKPPVALHCRRVRASRCRRVLSTASSARHRGATRNTRPRRGHCRDCSKARERHQPAVRDCHQPLRIAQVIVQVRLKPDLQIFAGFESRRELTAPRVGQRFPSVRCVVQRRRSSSRFVRFARVRYLPLRGSGRSTRAVRLRRIAWRKTFRWVDVRIPRRHGATRTGLRLL